MSPLVRQNSKLGKLRLFSLSHNQDFSYWTFSRSRTIFLRFGHHTTFPYSKRGLIDVLKSGTTMYLVLNDLYNISYQPFYLIFLRCYILVKFQLIINQYSNRSFSTPELSSLFASIYSTLHQDCFHQHVVLYICHY